MRTLTLSLEKRWFELIRDGIKLEEYREIKDYWIKRLVTSTITDRYGNCEYHFNQYDNIVFTLAYPPTEDKTRRIEFKKPKIRIDYGHAEWGAKIRTRYFVITWEKPKGK